MNKLFVFAAGVVLGYILFKENKKNVVDDTKEAGAKLKKAVDDAVTSVNSAPTLSKGIDELIFPQGIRQEYNSSEKATVSPAKTTIG